ncbi:MAG TPA: hypothetical protein VHP38_11550, partial [Ruminiclostridium sp.]|nr:hypothetical protein [Ruminiclostridium sp.]
MYSAYSGTWTGSYFAYNKDIKVGSDGKFDYTKAKGYEMDMQGNVMQLHDKGIVEIAAFGSDKLVFADSDYRAYADTIKSKKVTGKKTLSIKDAWYVR